MLKYFFSNVGAVGDERLTDVPLVVCFYREKNGHKELESVYLYQQLIKEIARREAAREKVPPEFEKARAEFESGTHRDIGKAP